MMQSMESLRIYRPRVVLHGPGGMGQGYIAAGALHFLEGYHIQSLDLGSLLSDSTRVRCRMSRDAECASNMLCRRPRQRSCSSSWRPNGINRQSSTSRR